MSYYTKGGFLARCDHCGSVLHRSNAPLTKRQAALYEWLYEHIEQHCFAPSFEEIAEQFGYASLATVHEHLTNLERKGWIHRRFNQARALECLVPLAAPSLAGQETTTT